jgi:DNA-binding GntR family transcriptional regulator
MPYDPGPLPEPWAPDDPRVLFQRVVDDILTKIETGELYPNARLPSARKMAEQYGVGVMTIQRALRELQQMRITYSIAGKGTFIHPDFADMSADAPLRDALADAATLHQLGVNPPKVWRTRLCGFGPPSLGHPSFVLDRR